ncbi:MAG: DUF2809 domain-containing protein [Leptolyngbyaceae cyanobacterium CSU_1_4]|nr:DUF2809 domain-containing protein [Leptolyngbyaceae cyanobacterium CSU_1_4]
MKPTGLHFLISIVLIIPLGYSVRFSTGLGIPLLQDIIGSLAYQVLLMLIASFFYPRASLVKIAVWVCVASCVGELLQLWQPPFLQSIRATWLGRIVLGNTFTLSDFPPYAVGSFLGWLGLKWLRQKMVHPFAA